MKTSLCVVATALVASVNAKDPQNAGDCKVTYDQELWSLGASSASDANSICEALVRFSKCLGQFPPDKDMEYLMITQEKEDFCAKQFEAKEPPSVRTARESLLLTVDDTKKIEFHRHRRETIDVFQMNANVNTLTDTVALLAKKIDQMTGTLTDTVTEIDGKLETSAQAIDGKLEKSAQDTKDALDRAADTQKDALGELRGDMGQLETKIDDKIKTQATNVGKLLEDLEGDVTDALTATTSKLSSQLKGNVTALNKKVTTFQADIATPKIHMWSGGSKGHSHGGGFAEFVIDRVEYDTAKPYFQKDSNTRFKALKTGLFTIKWNYMHYTHDNCNRLSYVYVNGKQIIYEYSSQQYWNKKYIEVTWRIKAGEQFWMTAQTDCGNPYRWHGGRSWDYTHGNRLQVTYVGDLTKGCKSNQGIC